MGSLGELMRFRHGRLVSAALLAFGVLIQSAGADSQEVRPDPKSAVLRGQYLFFAGGCTDCHTDRKAKGALGAGGGAIKTPFGTFFGPNITPHPQAGIGSWSEADFIRALRSGRAPNGAHYFPVFPFPSFTKMRDRDMRDLWAYLSSLPPSDRPNRPHGIGFPFNIRFLQTGWQWLFFTPGEYQPDPDKDKIWNRGAYLANAVTHCGECHTPRNLFGGIDRAQWMAGAKDGPEGELVPNITPDSKTGIGEWSEEDLVWYLEIGIDPDGDAAGSLMATVIEDSTSRLTDADRQAIARYILSLPPVSNDLSR